MRLSISILLLKEKTIYIYAKCNNYSHGVINRFYTITLPEKFSKIVNRSNIHIDFLLV